MPQYSGEGTSVRGGSEKTALAAAALLLLVLSAPAASATTRPRDGAVASSPPLLRWTAVAGARYYNLQLWRQGTTGNRKILSRWPTRHRFQLHHRWRYNGRLYRLQPARYYWYVWPWFGTRYGRVRVQRTFVYGRPPVNTSPPAVAGDAREGATLRATPGTWTGLPQPTVSYRWERCLPDGSACTTIAGATLSTYRIGAEDIDLVVRVVVVGANIARAVAVLLPPSAVVLAAPPNNVSRPTIAGHPHVSARLSAAAGDWLSSRPVTYSYRWFRCTSDGTVCARIRRATVATYRLRSADAAHRVAVSVTARNSGGANVATSLRSAVVGLLFSGTAGADRLRGTRGSDFFGARAGNDIVYGRRRGDRIYAGRGADHVFGGAGADVIRIRDRFRDWVDCGTGIDTVVADRRDRVRSNCEHVTRG
jgi:hypothetical protein